MAQTHGGNAWATCPVAAGGGTGSRPGLLGYRNVLRDPLPEEASTCGTAGRETLWRLARILHPTGLDLAAEENPGIPAGYTYLLQLVAHDCVHTPTPFWQIPAGRAAARNGRIARLRLDTLYGLGPFGTPIAYAADDARDLARSALRLGPPKGAPRPVAPAGLRDIARVADPALNRPGLLTDPLIADPRNEDHAILAQMTALWHMVHNAFLRLAPGRAHSGLPADRAQEARFSWARAATVLVYRRILRDDLLPRLLHPAVVARYRSAGEGDLLDRDMAYPRPRLSVPMEFSHGAMRAAHTMIRPHYRINDTADHGIADALRQTSARGAQDMPLGPGWLIRWSHFFDGVTADRAVNSSLRIRPRYLPALMSSEFFAGPAPGWGLAMQDLASAAAAPMWSVPALHQALARQAAQRGWPDPFAGCDLAVEETRRAALTAWLTAHNNPHAAFRGTEIADLAADPPLPFYILFEAGHVHDGTRLGPLGSILLAETFFGAMLADPLPGEEPGTWPGPSLRASLLALADTLRIRPEEGRLPEEATMGAVIRFVARERGLEAAEHAFL